MNRIAYIGHGFRAIPIERSLNSIIFIILIYILPIINFIDICLDYS